MTYENKNPLIILIAGKARSGKSTVGTIIKNSYQKKNLKVITSPYTKYLKRYIEEITNEKMDEDNKPRALLQGLSKDLIKDKLGLHNFFIDRQIEDINIYSYFADVIIVPDVRFPDEIDILKAKFKKVVSIGVIREDYTSPLTQEEQKDITEVALDNYQNYDYLIINKNENSLEKDTLKIIEEMGKYL